MLEIFAHIHKWNRSIWMVCAYLCLKLKTKNALDLFHFSCWEGDILTLWWWEHQPVDRHRGGDPPPRGHRHHFYPVLETVSDRQAGVPARCHDLHSAETKGKAPSLFDSMSNFVLSVFKIGTTVRVVKSVTRKRKQSAGVGMSHYKNGLTF